MSMFKKEEPKKEEPKKGPFGPKEERKDLDLRISDLGEKVGLGRKGESEVKAYFDEGIKLEGKLIFEGTARIDGMVVGEIFSKDTLIIGDKAKIEAQIEANVITISGNIQGNIVAKSLIHIRKTGKVTGDISTPSLIVEEGGSFDGHCQMSGVGASRGSSASLSAGMPPSTPLHASGKP